MGAGRPKGRRNSATLANMAVLATLPTSADPLEWLLIIMRCESLTMRLRLKAAIAAMPYLHPKP